MSTFNSFTPSTTHAATDRNIVYCYDLSAAPKGKLQLLSVGGIVSHGEINDPVKARQNGIWGWALCPVRDREEEERLGLGVHVDPPARWAHTCTARSSDVVNARDQVKPSEVSKARLDDIQWFAEASKYL